MLLLDADDEPPGWINLSQLSTASRLGPEAVDASSPLVTFETTLRDALAMLLASAVQTAVVVDERGRYAGVLTLDALGAAFRASPEPNRRPRPSSEGVAMRAGEALILWDWTFNHLRRHRPAAWSSTWC